MATAKVSVTFLSYSGCCRVIENDDDDGGVDVVIVLAIVALCNGGDFKPFDFNDGDLLDGAQMHHRQTYSHIHADHWRRQRTPVMVISRCIVRPLGIRPAASVANRRIRRRKLSSNTF